MNQNDTVEPASTKRCHRLRLCATSDVATDEGLRVELDGHAPFAVFLVEGEYFVTDDTCSHGDASLSEGTVENGQVECPWHSGSFCLRTGEALTFPAVSPIRVYAVQREGDELFIQLPSQDT